MGYLGMLVGSTMISLMLLAAVVRMRGQSPALLVSCVRDFLIGCGLAVTVLGLGVALFFIGRAFWKAAVYTK
jgi:type IV secretory pathway TrbD component